MFRNSSLSSSHKQIFSRRLITPPPCPSVCPAPPPGNHSTIRQVVSPADLRLGSSVRYRCNHQLSTADGHTEIVAVCEGDGWSVCEPDIQCNCESGEGELVGLCA